MYITSCIARVYIYSLLCLYLSLCPDDGCRMASETLADYIFELMDGELHNTIDDILPSDSGIYRQ